MNRNMQGENVLILGASKGLGLEIAKLTFDAGAVNIKASSTIVDGVKNIDGQTRKFYLNCDLTDEARTKDFLKRLNGLNRPIDRFFWVSGRLLKGPFAQATELEVLNTIDVNARNSSLVALHVWKQMQTTGRGKSFTIVASSSGETPRSDEPIYVATKHYQVGLGKSLALAAQTEIPGLKVTVFEPGGMKTETFWGRQPEKPEGYDDFLDPAKVAQKIVDDVLADDVRDTVIKIPRGSL